MFLVALRRGRSAATSTSALLTAVTLALGTLAACPYPAEVERDGLEPDGAALDARTDGHQPDGHAADAMTPDASDPRIPTVPGLLRPFDNARVGSVRDPASLRFELSWRPSTSAAAGEITYHLQLAPDPTFSSEVVAQETQALAFMPEAPLPVRTTAPVGARYYWRVKACSPEGLCSPFSETRRLDVGRSDRDFNGDGFDDLVISGSDTRARDAARAYVYLGGSQLDSGIDGRLAGATWFASQDVVASAGDVNGDGFADIIMGVHVVVPDGVAGRVHVYLGGSGDAFESSVDAVLSGEDDREGFGASIAGAGDVNGDGYADIIVGASRSEMPGVPGRAYVYFGGPGSRFDAVADQVISGAIAGDHFGWTVAGAGDVDGDGFTEVVIGSPAANVGKGHADILFGGPAGVADAVALAGEADIPNFGYVVAAAGDVNGDAFADLIVSAPPSPESYPGRVYVYLGGPRATFDADAEGVLGGTESADDFGHAVAAAGDVNGDGFADIVVSAPALGFTSPAPSRAYVFHGRAGRAFDPAPAGIVTGASRQWFGYAVASAGDINDDGLDDVLVTAPVARIGTVGQDPVEGRADIFRGRPGSDFRDESPFTIVGTEPGFFGNSVAR